MNNRVDIKISIIVPVYNIGKYISRCLDSITGQTYKNLEILLINDGSTDDSGAILDNHASKDGRVKVIHKENGGVSSARNAGLNAATGDYIMFVDGDDKISIDTCEVWIDSMSGHKDFIAFSVGRTDEDENLIEIEGSDNNSVQKRDSNHSILEQFLNSNFNLRVYAHLFKRSTLENLRFDESMRIYEDVLFSFEFMMRANSSLRINKAMYFYISRPGSAMKSFVDSDIKDVRNYHDTVINSILKKYPDLREGVRAKMMTVLFNLLSIAKRVGNKNETKAVRSEIFSTSKKLAVYRMPIAHKVKLALSYGPLFVFNGVLRFSQRRSKI